MGDGMPLGERNARDEGEGVGINYNKIITK